MKNLDSSINSETLENELTICLSNIGLNNHDNVYITGNMGLLGKIRMKKSYKLNAFLNSFWNIIGDKGTIFSPAASMNLCNTDIPFDIESTQSHEMGSFAEHIRNLPNSIRSFHPFWSVVGVGFNAHILNKVSRHAYGAGSPWSHFLNLDTVQVNVGIDPSRAVTLIHHIETLVGVPYRYTKEFVHPILKNGKVKYEPFYQSVFYNESNIKKRVALNEHYFNELQARGKIQSSIHSSGLEFKAFKMRDFYEVALEFFVDDIYNYLEEVPSVKPYNK